MTPPSPSAQRGNVRWPAVAVDLGLLLAAWGVAIALVDPRGAFPLDDDWAYAEAARRLLDDGVFRPPGWAGMTLLSQALWGAAVAAVGGFSHTALRGSTLLLGAVAIVATYRLAGRVGATRSVARLAALLLAGSPLFVVLAHTFMTDVPMLAMMLVALLGFARALQQGSRPAWLWGTLASVAAVLCRQPGLVPALGFAATVLLRPCDRRRWRLPAALSVVAVAGALWAFQAVMQAAGALPEGYWKQTAFLQRLWAMGAAGAAPILLGNLAAAALYTGLFLLPLLVVTAAGWARGRGQRWIAAATAAAAALIVWSSGKRMPLRGNVLIESGLGPVTLNDWYIRGLANDPRLPPSFWWAVTALGVVGVALLTAQLAGGLGRAWRGRGDAAAPAEAARTLLLATSALYLAVATAAVQFDRYFLPLVPLLGLALLPPADGRRAGPGSRAAGAVLLALYAAYAVAGTHDYLAWNRARWQALEELADAGVTPQRIDGGFEFNAPLFYRDGARDSGGRGHSWWFVVDDEYLIAMGPVPGYAIERRIPYRRWLPPVPAEIAVLRRTGG